jgi:hypothetical protein
LPQSGKNVSRIFVRFLAPQQRKGLWDYAPASDQILLIGRARGCPAADPRALAGEALRILATGA